MLVEDSPNDAELVLLELRRGGYRVQWERVQTGPDLERALEGDWEIVLSDYSMPSFSGLEALSIVKRKGIDVPFIIVSGTVGEEAAVGAMRAGAHDYVLKQSLVRLCPAIDRELREAELRASQKKMQEQLLISDRMASVGTLAAGVAHEINNPLAAIVANLELMSRDLTAVADRLDLTDRLHEVFDELSDARESADRLRHIVRDLKIFSRATDEEHRGAVEVQRVLESSLRMAWNEIRHRARLIKDYSEVPAVEANEARLGQVFLNLIVNAAQAIREGDADHNQIRVSTRQDRDGNIVTEIRDSGTGIPAENLTRIFDAFFTTKPVGVGTGLGLSICHRIVSGLGGSLEVESEVGKGSVFRVVLPPARSNVRPLERQSLPTPAKTRRGRVLVVDDEPMIATAIGRTLAFDHEVVVSGDAADALEKILSGERFDVVLCDLMMPQMTGMDLHAALAENAPDQAERMVFLSGGAFTAAARAFLDEVPNERLEKPFDTHQLSAIVNDRIR
ncbi:MAG TPA: response regulator [Polyangiaceae bacterium]|nr:response regulator [Polyangiaceae bacterium]